jgi:hypothetical protein
VKGRGWREKSSIGVAKPYERCSRGAKEKNLIVLNMKSLGDEMVDAQDLKHYASKHGSLKPL